MKTINTMKNFTIMKRLIFLLSIILIITACSSDDSGNSSDPDNPGNENYKFLSSVVNDPTEPKEDKYDDLDTIVYENGKPLKALLAAGNYPFSIYQYEYGNNGKVSVIYIGNFNPHEDVGNDYEDQISRFENTNLDEDYDRKTTIEYNSNNEIKKETTTSKDSDIVKTKRYKYDTQNRLYKITEVKPVYTTIYTVKEFNDKNIPKTIRYNENGNIGEHSFEYSDLKNPYYAFFDQFGISHLDKRNYNSDLPEKYMLTSYSVNGSSIQIYNYTSFDDEYPETLYYTTDYGNDVNYKFNYK